MAQWHNMFWIAAYVLIASSAFYSVVGSGEVQPWNNPESDNKHESSKGKSNLDTTANWVPNERLDVR